jgi:hypothetical protein
MAIHLAGGADPCCPVGMSQEQKIVPLILKTGETNKAAATGNNAAWLCSCGRALPLIGRSGSVKGVSDNTRVECPSCKRSYFVVPDGYDKAAAVEVRET